MFKTKEQRRREQKSLLKQRKNKELIDQKKIEKERLVYPSFIATILKRSRRIDPWHGVASFEPLDCALITFFKLRQFGMSDIRISNNTEHTWVEFKYNEEWWIFDPIAVRKLSLGEPLKRQKFNNVEIYNNLNRYFYDIDAYIENFESILEYDSDEAKIAAMKDSGLNSIFRIKYF